MLRSRSFPEGTPGLCGRRAAYVAQHNRMVDASVSIARAAFHAGATFVIENPIDRGRVGSIFFQRKWRQHAPLWLMPAVQELQADTDAHLITFPQCALGGQFQKWTTLMVAGPAAGALQPLDGLRCDHHKARHTRVAKGTEPDGSPSSAAAAAYPPIMNVVVVGLLTGVLQVTTTAEVREAASSEDATAYAAAVTRIQEVNQLWAARFCDSSFLGASEAAETSHLSAQSLEPARTLEWLPQAMPLRWPEAAEVTKEEVAAARLDSLRYLSRRRALPENPAVLFATLLPSMDEPPTLPQPPITPPVGWPADAPPPPIHISQLYNRGVYDQIKQRIALIQGDIWRAEEAARQGLHPAPMPPRAPLVFAASRHQPPWARSCVWDTSTPEDCRPLQPFSADDPPQQAVSREFFMQWGERLAWPDKDMLYRVCVSGVDSRAQCTHDTVIHGHHTGLRETYLPAREAVHDDAAAGWTTLGTTDLQTVPARLVPRNVITKDVWRVDDAGQLISKRKFRVTTDDSIAVNGSDSRNATLDRDSISNISLPTLRKFAESVAVLKSTSQAHGVQLDRASLPLVAMWALDLEKAYRQLAAARHELWLQGFIWWDGVRVDRRCVFGSAHLVDFFQRVTSFVLAVAATRIRKYEAAHPGSAPRQAWQQARREKTGNGDAFSAFVYLDDAFGAALVEDEAEVGVATPPRVTTIQEFNGDGSVRLLPVVARARPSVHLAIVAKTFQDAGWDIAIEKVQLGWSLDLLGLCVDSRGDGAAYVTEAKRQGLLHDIAAQRQTSTAMARSDVERLVGRLSHVAAVAAEGNAYLAPLYRIQNATVRVKRRRASSRPAAGLPDGPWRTIKPPFITVNGAGPSQREYQAALDWWHEALAAGVSVPLAPQLQFPELGSSPGVGFIFTDAAREDGTGFGGFTILRKPGHVEPLFLYITRKWDMTTLHALQDDIVSMPAGELCGAVALLDAVLRFAPELTHLLCFTDSKATASTLTHGNSGAPQLNRLARWLFERHRRVQFLGIHCPGVKNKTSDALSRGQWEAVLAEAVGQGWQLLELVPDPLLMHLMRSVIPTLPTRHVAESRRRRKRRRSRPPAEVA